MAFFGFIAGILTTGCWVPQISRIMRTRSASDFSYLTLAILTAGVGLWFVYGIGLRNVPLIVFNGLTLIFDLTIVALKFCYEREAGQAA